MATKNFFKLFVLVFAALVCGQFLTSCDDSGLKSEQSIAKKNVPVYEDKITESIDSVADPMTETVTIEHNGSTGIIRLEITQKVQQNPVYITEAQKNLTGNLVGTATNSLTPSWTWNMNDGNVMNVTTKGATTLVDGDAYSVTVHDAKVVRCWNVAKAVQSSEEKERMDTYATVQYVTRVKSGGMQKDTTFYKTSVWERIILKGEDPVIPDPTKTGDELVNSGFEVQTGHIVNWWVETRPVYSDGTKGEVVRHTYNTNYGFETIGLGTHNVSDFNFSFKRANGMSTGNEAQDSQNGNWTVYRRAKVYTAVVGNAAKEINTKYTLNERRTRFTMGSIVVNFEYPSYNLTEKSTVVADGAPALSGMTGKVLTNTVNTIYGGRTESLNENGLLYKENEVEIKKTFNWDKSTANLTTNSTTTTAQVTGVYYENGKEVKRVTKKISVARSQKALTNWAANEADASQSTGSASNNVSKANKSKDEWTYVEETYVYENKSTLKASTQRNAVQAIEGNDFKVTLEGKTYSFSHITPTMSADGGKVSKASETNEATVYNYNCGWNYSFNGQSSTLSTPGKITVKKSAPVIDEPFNGDLKGQYKSSGCTATLEKNTVSDWGYGVSITTTAGTYAFFVPKAKTSVTNGAFWSGDTFAYNGAFWYQNQWVPCVAKNTDKALRWENKSQQNYRSISYSSAQTFHFNGNKNTVKTDDVKIVVEKSGNHNVIKIMAGSKVLKSLTDSSK